MRKRMLLARLIAWSSACKRHPSSQNRSRIVALVIGVWIKEENNNAIPIYKHHPVKLLVSEKIVLPSTTQPISKHSMLTTHTIDIGNAP
jgi:hypothetical protein